MHRSPFFSRIRRKTTNFITTNSHYISLRGNPPSTSLSPFTFPSLLHLRAMSSSSTLPPAPDAPKVQGVAPDALVSDPLDPATAVDKVAEKLSKVKVQGDKKEKVKKDKASAAPSAKIAVSPATFLTIFCSRGHLRRRLGM